ncbi:hypothetical protein NDU88_000530, partial [Pleurodeles waltl]
SSCFEFFPTFFFFFPLGLLLEGTICFGVSYQAAPRLLERVALILVSLEPAEDRVLFQILQSK